MATATKVAGPNNAGAAVPPQKILRIGVIQAGKIVEERLVRRREPVTIGASARNTIVVPASSLPRSFTLFELHQGNYSLIFTDTMDGRVSVGDQVMSLEQLKQSGRVAQRGKLLKLERGRQLARQGAAGRGHAAVSVRGAAADPAAAPAAAVGAGQRGGPDGLAAGLELHEHDHGGDGLRALPARDGFPHQGGPGRDSGRLCRVRAHHGATDAQGAGSGQAVQGGRGEGREKGRGRWAQAPQIQRQGGQAL